EDGGCAAREARRAAAALHLPGQGGRRRQDRRLRRARRRELRARSRPDRRRVVPRRQDHRRRRQLHVPADDDAPDAGDSEGRLMKILVRILILIFVLSGCATTPGVDGERTRMETAVLVQRLLGAAENARAYGTLEGAEEAYRQVLALDPNN